MLREATYKKLAKFIDEKFPHNKFNKTCNIADGYGYLAYYMQLLGYKPVAFDSLGNDIHKKIDTVDDIDHRWKDYDLRIKESFDLFVSFRSCNATFLTIMAAKKNKKPFIIFPCCCCYNRMPDNIDYSGVGLGEYFNLRKLSMIYARHAKREGFKTKVIDIETGKNESYCTEYINLHTFYCIIGIPKEILNPKS